MLGPDPPEFLYRYRPPSDIEAGWARDTIVDGRVYFTSPQRFNDPFDCRVVFQPTRDPRKWRALLKALLKRATPLNFSQREKEISRKLASGKHLDESWIREIASHLQRAVDDSAMLCLTEKPDDVLMWSHYGLKHAGFCLQYRSRADPMLWCAGQVRYQIPYPRIAISDDYDVQIRSVLLTKADPWQYENEWRVIRPMEAPGVRSINKASLVGVIAGARMESSGRKRLEDLCRRRKPPVDLYQALLEPDSYAISIAGPV